MTHKQARQEAERRVLEYFYQTPHVSNSIQCALISINREIELLDELRPYISGYGLKYYQRELDDLNQIKDELLKM
jgi:hypothetical protein